jgi:serine/alanine adding enzyme
MDEVTTASLDSGEEWDRYVRAHPDATVYHLAAWAQILARSYRFQPRYLALRGERGELTGVMPLARRRGLLTGRRLRSLPTVEIGGPLANGRAGEEQLLAAASELARREGARLIVDSTRPLPVADLAEIPRPPTWIAPVPPQDGFDEWLKERSSNLRRGVKRARSRGVEVRLADSEEDLRSFYRLYLATMRKHRSLPRAWRQLQSARQLLGTSVFRLFLAENEGRAIAGGVFHDFGGTIELLYNGSDDSALDLRPNHALYAEVVRWAGERGIAGVDYGFAWPGTGLAGFKQQWGAESVPRHRYSNQATEHSSQAAEEPQGGSSSRLRGAAERVWDRTPLPLTRAAAALVYRYA